jgi:hypothetical protein
MNFRYFFYLLFGFIIGFMPTIIQLIKKKMAALNKFDPIEEDILKETLRNLAAKKASIKQPETVVNMNPSSSSKSNDSSIPSV